MDVPSRQAVAVQLGPTQGISPTVYLSDDAHALSSSLRQDLSETVERQLRHRARLIDPRRSSRLKNAFAAYEFGPGTLPHEALQLVRRARAWFFQSLAPAKDQQAERKHRRARRKITRMAKRHERRLIKRNFRPLRGALVHSG